MSGFIWGVYVSCVSLGTQKPPIMLLLKFMLLEYWEEEEEGGEPNSRQGHVPVERANNASANPSPSTAL